MPIIKCPAPRRAALAADVAGRQPARVAQSGAQGGAGQHQHVLLERALETQFVGPGGVVKREVASREAGAAAVLHDHAFTARLDADKEIVFARVGDLGRRAAHGLRAGRDA